MQATIAAARAGATTGEWAQALRDAFGSYRAPTGVGEAAAAIGDERPRGAARRGRPRQRGARAGALKILVGKPGPRRPLQRRRADRRARARRRHGRRLRGHPPDPVADRQERGRGGRARRRPLDPLRLAPRADPRRRRGAARGGLRRAGRRRRDHPRGRRRAAAGGGRRRGLHAEGLRPQPASCATSSRSWPSTTASRPRPREPRAPGAAPSSGDGCASAT